MPATLTFHLVGLYLELCATLNSSFLNHFSGAKMSSYLPSITVWAVAWRSHEVLEQDVQIWRLISDLKSNSPEKKLKHGI